MVLLLLYITSQRFWIEERLEIKVLIFLLSCAFFFFLSSRKLLCYFSFIFFFFSKSKTNTKIIRTIILLFFYFCKLLLFFFKCFQLFKDTLIVLKQPIIHSIIDLQIVQMSYQFNHRFIQMSSSALTMCSYDHILAFLIELMLVNS